MTKLHATTCCAFHPSFKKLKYIVYCIFIIFNIPIPIFIPIFITTHFPKSKKIIMPVILEVVLGIIGAAIGGTCYANRKK